MIEGPSIYMKIHAIGEQLILAACDKELLGKTITEGEIFFKVSDHFYGGDLVNEETLLNMMKQITSANIVGNHCVGILIDAGIIESTSILTIEGIKHTQLYDVSNIG